MHQDNERSGTQADHDPETRTLAQRAAQEPAEVQILVDIAAEMSHDAWLLTGKRAAFLLAEARPTFTPTGARHFDGMQLRDRASKARELAAAWTAAAEGWEATERQTLAP